MVNAITGVKIKLFSVLMDFKKIFQTRFTPFTVETNYILTTITRCLPHFPNVNDVRIPLLFKVKSSTSLVIIPLL